MNKCYSWLQSKMCEYPKLTILSISTGLAVLGAVCLRNRASSKLFEIKTCKQTLKKQKKEQHIKDSNHQTLTIQIEASPSKTPPPTAKALLIRCRTTHKARAVTRIIVYLHSQHQTFNSCLPHAQELGSSTMSDVIVVDYCHLWDSGGAVQLDGESGIKFVVDSVVGRVLQIGSKQNKNVIIYGKNLGASLAIHTSTANHGHKYLLKGLILQNIMTCLPTHISHKQTPKLLQPILQTIYSLILADQWQITHLISQLKLPTMLIIKENEMSDSIGQARDVGHSLQMYAMYRGRKVVGVVRQRYGSVGVGGCGSTGVVEDWVDCYMEIDMFMNGLG